MLSGSNFLTVCENHWTLSAVLTRELVQLNPIFLKYSSTVTCVQLLNSFTNSAFLEILQTLQCTLFSYNMKYEREAE